MAGMARPTVAVGLKKWGIEQGGREVEIATSAMRLLAMTGGCWLLYEKAVGGQTLPDIVTVVGRTWGQIALLT